MRLDCQQDALSNLKVLAKQHHHGVLVSGVSGCGKTYLARQYAEFLSIPDFYSINPAVSDLRTTIDTCVALDNPIVLCIENLDKGVVQASYPLLKLIEDCPEHIYVVVTCSNIHAIPDTILSRCALVSIQPPTHADLETYAKHADEAAFGNLIRNPLWQHVSSLHEVDILLKLTPEQTRYFENLQRILPISDTVSNVSWKLQHYEDKTETPIVLVIKHLMSMVGVGGRRACISCLNDLADNKISKNAVVSKLVFDLKYIK